MMVGVAVVVGVAVGDEVAMVGVAVGDKVGGSVGARVGVLVGGEAVGIWVGAAGVGASVGGGGPHSTVAHMSTWPSLSASNPPTTLPFMAPEPVSPPATMDWWHKPPVTSLQHKIPRAAAELVREGELPALQDTIFSASPGWVQSVHPSGKYSAYVSMCRQLLTMLPMPVAMAPADTRMMAAPQHSLS